MHGEREIVARPAAQLIFEVLACVPVRPAGRNTYNNHRYGRRLCPKVEVVFLRRHFIEADDEDGSFVVGGNLCPEFHSWVCGRVLRVGYSPDLVARDVESRHWACTIGLTTMFAARLGNLQSVLALCP